MAMKQGLYAQVVMLHQKDLIFTEANKNKNEVKFKFHSQYTRSQCWFDIDFDWIEVSFSTREPDFYKKLCQSHENTQATNTFKWFQVPTGNSKCVETFKIWQWCPDAQVLSKVI